MKKLLIIASVLVVSGCITDDVSAPAVVRKPVVILKSDKHYEAKMAVLVQAKAPNSVVFDDVLYNAKLDATCGYMSDAKHADGAEQFIYSGETKNLTLKSNFSEERFELFQSSWEVCVSGV